MDAARADVVVLTVLPEEYEAVVACLHGARFLSGSFDQPNTYAWCQGTIESSLYQRPFSVIVGKGTPTTTYGALATAHAIQRFAPGYIIFVGIAGGFPLDGQQHGDVAVSSFVYSYEYGKIGSHGFEPRKDFTYRCDEGLLRWADVVSGHAWWRDEDNPGRAPRARIGMIASGDKVIDQPSDQFFTAVHAQWPKLLAVEMEGAGVAAAIHDAHAERKPVGFLLVRGISDMPRAVTAPADAQTSTEERDTWKRTAARNAARFFAYLLDTGWPVPPTTPDPTSSTPPDRTEPDAARSAEHSIDRPRPWQYLLDRWAPRLHGWLRRAGAVHTPREYRDVTDAMRALKAELAQNIADRTKAYVPVHARSVPRVPSASDDGGDQFVRPIHQVVRAILGRAEGGDSVSAELAMLNRHSRMVRDLTRTLCNADEPLVLLGDPGTGKSMTLQRVACEVIDRELQRVFPALTLYVPLGEFHVAGQPSRDDVRAYARRALAANARPWFDALEAAGRLVILFDGMDEMSRDHYTEHTEALSVFAGSQDAHTRTLFSCRITDFSPRFTHRRYVLVPFDRSQILSYLRDYFRPANALEIEGERWSLSRLAKRLAQRELSVDATNPFTLWLLCHHLYTARRWPTSRVELLRDFLAKTYQRKQANRAEREGHEPAWPAQADCELAFAELAYLITEGNRGRALAIADWIAHTGREHATRAMASAGRALGFLVESVDAQHVRFDHHRLQEYFTALYLHHHQAEIAWLDKLDVPRWQETMINLVLLGHGEAAVTALAAALHDPVERVVTHLQAYNDEDERRAQAVAEAPTQATPSEPADAVASDFPTPLLEPEFSTHDEILLGDRVELAARIARDAAAADNAAPAQLLPPLRRAVEFLIEQGNPITQVKMIRASAHLADPDLLTAARKPLTSDVAWVRTQALILLAENRSKIGVNIASEIGFDLGRGVLLTRIPSYLRVLARTRQPGATRAFVVGLMLRLFQLAIFVAIAAGLYWGARTEYGYRHIFEHINAVEHLALPPASLPLFCSAMIVAAGGAQLWESGKYRDLAIVGIIGPLLGAEYYLPTVWNGEPLGLLLAFALAACFLFVLGLAHPQFWLCQLVVTLATSTLYCVATRRARAGDSSSSLRSMLRVWLTTNPWRTELLWGQAIILLFAVLEWICSSLPWLRLVLKVGLIAVFAVLPVAFVLLLATISVIDYFKKPRSEWKWRWRAWASRAASVALILVGTFTLLWIVRYLWHVFLRFFAGHRESVSVGVAYSVAVMVALPMAYRVRSLYFRWRPSTYPPGTFTPKEWCKLIARAKPQRQVELIVRTDHQSISVNPTEFLAVLGDIETVIRDEPALSTYWQHRAELEQVLKQERRG